MISGHRPFPIRAVVITLILATGACQAVRPAQRPAALEEGARVRIEGVIADEGYGAYVIYLQDVRW